MISDVLPTNYNQRKEKVNILYIDFLRNSFFKLLPLCSPKNTSLYFLKGLPNSAEFINMYSFYFQKKERKRYNRDKEEREKEEKEKR